VLVVISDNGRGIPSEDLPHVFERYWRKTSSTRIGTGLGLFIAYGIIKAHGGNLRVDSEVGQGTKFTFNLLAAQGPGLVKSSTTISHSGLDNGVSKAK
jgi:signal transduction histidine kinase